MGREFFRTRAPTRSRIPCEPCSRQQCAQCGERRKRHALCRKTAPITIAVSDRCCFGGTGRPHHRETRLYMSGMGGGSETDRCREVLDGGGVCPRAPPQLRAWTDSLPE